jgi:molybdopterin-guanine dinucleotide biosynthesis protein A
MGEHSAFVLAGGKSTRMGRDKAFIRFEGSTLLARALKTASAVSASVFIVGEARKFSRFAPVVEDEYRDQGPLGGIHAALRHSVSELNIMLAVDLPFVSGEFLRFLLGRAEICDQWVTVPEADGQLQPLCAVYRRNFAELAEKALRDGQNKIGRLFTPQVARVTTEDEWRGHGFARNTFHNLNSPHDVALAERAESAL